jgi:hypothetical protein
MARTPTSDRIVDYRWQEWHPNYEPADYELLTMTNEEFDIYNKSVRKYAMTRRKAGFRL